MRNTKNETRPPVTMKDLARRLGVHTSTVSLALRNSPEVGAATRERVRQAAQEMGYQPNPFVSALMRSRRQGKLPPVTATLGFLTFYGGRRLWRENVPVMAGAFEHAQVEACRRGFQLEEIWGADPAISPDRLGEILYARGIGGVILSTFPLPRPVFDWDWNHLSIVALGPSLLDPRAHRVRSNHFQTMMTNVQECAALGYRRIGLALFSYNNERMGYRWEAAYDLQRKRLNLDLSIKPLFAGPWNRETLFSWFYREKPEMIITTGPAQVHEWLESEGISVPDDVGLASLSCKHPEDFYSGVYENPPLQGARAASMLIDLVKNNERGLSDYPQISMVNGRWNPGKTVTQR